LGIAEIMLYCSVNDGAVMTAWKKDQKCDAEDCLIKFYADPTSEFTKAAGVLMMDHPGPISVGILDRCKRYIMFVDDGKIVYKVIAEDVDFDPAGDDFPEKVLPEQIIPKIKEIWK